MQILSGCILSNILGLLLLVLTVRAAKKERVPLKTRILLVIAGCLLMPPVVALQTVAGYVGEMPFVRNHPLFHEMFMSVLRLALIEELCKFWGTKAVAWKGAYFANSYQGLLFPTAMGLSFGIFETVLYMLLAFQQFHEQFWLIVLLRAFLGAPAHGAYGVLMGIFYGRAKRAAYQHDRTDRRRCLWLALLLPTGIHGLYDWLVSSQILRFGDSSLMSILAIAADAIVILYAYHLLYRAKAKKQVWGNPAEPS